MVALPSKTLAQFVADMVAAWAAALQAAGVLPPGAQPVLQDGDALFATMQSVAGQLVFVQAQVQLVNAVARAQTAAAKGLSADVDTFLAQFSFARLGGGAASGPVTFGKLSPATSQVLIAPGTVVQTVGGAIAYAVVADTAQPTWNAGLGAYVLAVGQTSLVATVTANAIGTGSNVTAGQLSQIATPLPGIDTVTNAAPITNGINAESDQAALARFVLFINSLSKATFGALKSALAGVGNAIAFNLLENIDVSNHARPGEFVAVVDNGSGAPPASLLTLAQAAIEVTRGFTILGIATPVTPVTVTIVIAVRTATGGQFVQSVVNAAVASAVAAGINATAIGGVDEATGVVDPFLHVSDVEGFALAVPGVVSVRPGTTINTVAADFALTGFQAARTDINHVTVGNY